MRWSVFSFVQGRGRIDQGLTGQGACCSLVGNANFFLTCLGSFKTPGGQASASTTHCGAISAAFLLCFFAFEALFVSSQRHSVTLVGQQVLT